MSKRDSIFLYIIRTRVAKTIIVILLSFHLVWMLNWIPYYIHSSGYEKSKISCEKHIDGMTFYVVSPVYPSFTGNYAITNEEGMVLIIWPRSISHTTAEYGFDSEKYRCYIDKSGRYCRHDVMPYSEEEEKEIEEFIKNNRDILMEMIDAAEKEWGL